MILIYIIKVDIFTWESELLSNKVFHQTLNLSGIKLQIYHK